jgi:capsular exopolysaccharide synthesis family protein
MSSPIDNLTTADEGARLRQYLGFLRRRKWSIALVTVFAVGGAWLYADRTTPIYEATAAVQATNTVLLPGTATGANLSMQTEEQAVTSDPVARCAALLLADQAFRADPAGTTLETSAVCTDEAMATAIVPGGVEPHVSVTVPAQTNVLQISFDDPSSRAAQVGAQAFALGYINSKVVRAQQLLDQLRAPLLDAQESLSKEVTKLNAELDRAIQDNAEKPPTAAGAAQVQNLTSQRNAAQQKLDNITLQILNLDPSHINPPQLILPAKLPHAPVSPNKVLAGALGLFVGLGLGIAFGLVRERLDESLHGRADLEEAASAPVLTVVPRVRGRRGEARLVVRDDPKGIPAEAYRKLRTSVQFAAAQRQLKVLMVGSAVEGEGKTTTAANLSVLLAEGERRVILMSVDLRRPRLDRYFDLEPGRGLSDVLAGRADLLDVLVDSGIENLRILSSGPVPDRPAELLQSRRMAEVLEEARELADYVIVDTAPLLLVSESLGVALLADGVLLVADAGKTSRWQVRHAREQLEEVAVSVVGAVLNKFDRSRARGYPDYGYYYGPYGYTYGRENGAGEGEAGVRDSTSASAARGAGAMSRRRRSSN